MTREEAIKHIKDIICENNTVKHSDMVVFENEKEALRIAIQTLSQEPCDDAVSRADLGLTDFEIVMCNGDYKEALKMLIDKIQKAPSVVPKSNENQDAISREAVLSLWGLRLSDKEIYMAIHDMPSVTPKSTKSTECEDAISREDVIKLVECSGYDLQFRTDNADMCDDVRKLPPVTPSRRKGHWIITYPFGKNEPIYECPYCKASNNSVFKNFCPNCGAEMVEPKESEDKE